MEVDVATNMGIKTSIQELENDTEPFVMGVQWHSSLVRENCSASTRLVNIDTFSNPMSSPLDAIEDKAEEDKILEDAKLDVYPEAAGGRARIVQSMFFDPDFSDQLAQVNSPTTWPNSFQTIVDW